ncbi:MULTISPECIES: ATP synthase F0 subunit B [unclassified Streptomyces]|uniref:ATP synthase F0 subunit B n=1 Tax=unclassified Streptomyces TaxID=2593676 RepID=UPI002E7A4959|nr:ATP synthase F0 subunit B [Streptomyces sp. JV176]MEE1798814.1 ATP synthase F0 subunit B [Streptomyces sp. JV176]
MDVQKKLDEIVDTVGNARSMPMSASCVVNRAELLALLEEVREALPDSLAQARELIGGQEQLAEQARQEAERIIEGAHAQRSTLISDTAVARRSQEEADRILSEARREAEEIRAEADDYVDSKLANFEVVLTKTIGSVDRGREKLLGRSPGSGEPGYAGGDDDDAPEYSADPSTLIRRADEYVDAKIGAFEAVLTKTLEAVGRGRQKLHGRTESDELGAHMAAQDAAGPQARTSDADYLADLAGTPREALQAPVAAPRQPPAPPEPVLPPVPAQQPYTDPAYAQTAQQPAGTGYQDGGYDTTGGYQDPAYPATDPGYGAGYPQQDAYGYQQDPYTYQQQGQQGYGQDLGQGAQQAQQQAQGYDPNYGWQQQQTDGRPALPALPAAPADQQQGALDETSFFDTSMIDLEQLRRYEQGH